jgi:hypothetical protein
VADPQPNYDYSGIGKAEALLVFSALAASPLVWFTTGFPGTVTFWLLTKACTWLANKEVMIMNLAAADINTIAEHKVFDGSFDEAFKEIHGNPNQLSQAQKASIDNKVIAAARAFFTFGSLRDSSSS